MDRVLRDGRPLYSRSTGKSIDAHSTAVRPLRSGQLDRGVEPYAEGMVRKRGRTLAREQLMTREFVIHLRPKRLAFRFVVVAQFEHPFVPDSLQMFLVCGRAVRRGDKDRPSGRGHNPLKSRKSPCGKRGQSFEVDDGREPAFASNALACSSARSGTDETTQTAARAPRARRLRYLEGRS